MSFTDIPHSPRCWCDGCARARRYLARVFPDPALVRQAIAVVWDGDEADEVDSHTQQFITAYKDAARDPSRVQA